MGKLAVLLLALIIATSSIVVIKPVYSVSTPSVPEFTVKLVAHPYDVPTTYGIDPYTGKNVTIQEGHHAENESIEVTIKNQPLSPYKDANGNYISLYYNVSYKGHYGNDWSYYPDYGGWYPASHSDYTVIPFSSGGNNQSSYTSSSQAELGANISPGGQVDFRVQAITGNVTEIHTGFIMFGTEVINYDVITVETSDWSSTQTVTVNGLAFDEGATVILGVLVVAVVLGVIVGLLVYFKKRKPIA